METEEIFEALSKYIKPVLVEQLKLAYVLNASPGALVMCITVAEIMKYYNSSVEDEMRVSALLSLLCKNHFSNFIN